VKQDVKKPKRPIGAVSMFGGLDPSALLKGRRPTSSFSEEDKDLKDEKEEKKDEDEANTKQEKSPEAVPASKLKLDLFTDDIDVSSEDMFSSKSEAEAATEDVTADKHDKEEAATPKPESTKPKKPAGAVSMFGGLDPSAFLKKKKVEVSDEEEDEKTDKEKLPPPETAPKPKVAVRDRHDSNTKPKSLLFGTVDDNDDDDFFSATKKKVPPPTAPKSPLPTPTEPSRPEGELPSPEPPRGKKLAGAVSMFGGLDPFAGFKKKSVSVEEDEKDSSPPREEHLKSPTINVDGPPSFLGQALQRSDSVDFDQPAEADTLSSAIKDRPKLNRRRPPSRKARMLAATSTGISFEDVTPTSPTTPTIPEVPDSPSFDSTTTLKSATNEPSGRDKISDSGADKSKSKTADLFGNDDLVDGPPLSRDKPLMGEDEKDNSVFSKDLFGGKSAKFSSSAGKDLFSTSKKDGASSLEKSQISDSKSAASPKTDKKDQVEDDLFSQPTAKSKSNFVTDILNKDDMDSPMPEGAGQKAKAVPSLGDDDDDIFASSSVKSTAGKGSKSKLAADTIKKRDSTSASKSGSSETDTQAKSSAPAAASLGDDDLFANSSLDKSKDTKTKSGTLAAVAKKNDLEEGRNADETKNVRPKKAVTKVDTLLSDTTDIFSDIPDPTPKEPRKKAAARKTVEKKAVFRDDVDDIFAGTSAAVVKPKRDVKKKVTKTATVDSDNIFDDPLS
jgi:WASH complex subunit FAM21